MVIWTAFDLNVCSHPCLPLYLLIYWSDIFIGNGILFEFGEFLRTYVADRKITKVLTSNWVCMPGILASRRILIGSDVTKDSKRIPMLEPALIQVNDRQYPKNNYNATVLYEKYTFHDKYNVIISSNKYAIDFLRLLTTKLHVGL